MDRQLVVGDCHSVGLLCADGAGDDDVASLGGIPRGANGCAKEEIEGVFGA